MGLGRRHARTIFNPEQSVLCLRGTERSLGLHFLAKSERNIITSPNDVLSKLAMA